MQEKDICQRCNNGRKLSYGAIYAMCAYFLFQSSYLVQTYKLDLTKECTCHNKIILL